MTKPPSPIDVVESTPSAPGDVIASLADGTLIDWLLARPPEERLEILAKWATGLLELRRGLQV